MIVAGIDEAGYGPLLGPLVVGCSAFEVADAQGEEPPCLWRRLGRVVSKNRGRSGRKLHVNDSKLVYSPAHGLKELERSVLCFAAAAADMAAGLDDLLQRLAGDCVPDLAEHPWYAPPAGEAFPVEQEAVGVRLMANALRAEMQRAGVRCVRLAARVVPERRLNRMFDATRNKSSVLFSLSAMHLDQLLREFGQNNLVIWCDRQGGREHYGHLLRLMFEEWSLQVLHESDGLSDYRLTRDGHIVRLLFREKAEAGCLAVAMASMISKYLREMLMRRFNAWWANLLPELTPTAGYYTDGVRFLQDIDVKRRELGIADAALIRAR